MWEGVCIYFGQIYDYVLDGFSRQGLTGRRASRKTFQTPSNTAERTQRLFCCTCFRPEYRIKCDFAEEPPSVKRSVLHTEEC